MNIEDVRGTVSKLNILCEARIVDCASSPEKWLESQIQSEKKKKCDIQKRLFYAIETITTSADNLLPSTRTNIFLRPGVAKNSVAASIFGPSE